MSDVENELRSRVDSFVNELSALIRRQALEAVEEVLKKGGEGAAPTRKVGRPAKAAVEEPKARGAKATTAKAAPAKPSAAAKRKAGEKRTPQQLAAITEQVFNYIKSNPGQGVEQIAKALATSTKELTLPIRKLLTDKKVGSKGQKRATRYFPR
ncbi:MAG: DNA-binding protein [Minicystis sp.]